MRLRYSLLILPVLLLTSCLGTEIAPSPVPLTTMSTPVVVQDTPAPTLTPTPTTVPPTTVSSTATPMPLPAESDGVGTDDRPWWFDRVFYEVFVRSFKDGNGDGIGDIQGLIDKLDYLNDGDPTTTTDLGITGLWLMPMAESPSYHGYDVVDYKTVERDYGTSEDFKRLIEEAHKRGIVVIVDLVTNHTSVEHPWFQDSRLGEAPYNDWYVWTDEPAFNVGPWGQPVWHRAGDRYYYGVFWEGMPDLNLTDPDVTAALEDAADFWLAEMGVDGFRMDAIKHLIENGAVQENTPATHEWLKQYRQHVKTTSPTALLVGEAWTETEEAIKYMDDEMDLVFEFDLAQALLTSARQETRTSAAIALGAINALPKTNSDAANLLPGQYASFLTNHDQNRVMSELAGDVDKARSAASMLLTSPGVPFIYYGEEIGMQGMKPDERIRTPMQWDATTNAGFSDVRPWQPLGSNWKSVNVVAQTDDPNSLLSHYRDLIRLRQVHPALRVGDYAGVKSSDDGILAFLRTSETETLLVIINLSGRAISDYTLTLGKGLLTAGAQASLVYGEGEPASPQVNANGGFAPYQPLPSLAPYSTTVLALDGNS